MGKRRKQRAWVAFNMNAPRRMFRRETREATARRPHDRKLALIGLYADGPLGDHGGKLLEVFGARGMYYIQMRNREPETSYYTVRSRGNRLEAIRTRVLVDGVPVNVFMHAFTGDFSSDPVETREVTVLCRVPLREHERFCREFREATPDLGWFDSDEGGVTGSSDGAVSTRTDA